MLPNTAYPNLAKTAYQNGGDKEPNNNNLSASLGKMSVQTNGPYTQPPFLPTFRPATNGTATSSPRPTLPPMPRLPQFLPNNGHFHSSASQPVIQAPHTPSFASYPRPLADSENIGIAMTSSQSQPNLANQAINSSFSPSMQQPPNLHLGQQINGSVSQAPNFNIRQPPLTQQTPQFPQGHSTHSNMANQSINQPFTPSVQAVHQAGNSYSGQQLPNQSASQYGGQGYGQESQQMASRVAPPTVPYNGPAFQAGQISQAAANRAPQFQAVAPVGGSGQAGFSPGQYASSGGNTNAVMSTGAYYPQPSAQNIGAGAPGSQFSGQQQHPPLPPGSHYPQSMPGYQGNSSNGYPQNSPGFQAPNGAAQYNTQPGTIQGGPHAEGSRLVNLLQSRRILPPGGVEVPTPVARHEFNNINCSPDIFRCTLNVIPNTPALLQKSRLPLAILLHPYKDLSSLQVLACNTIVRCRACRSYINPFVTFIDQWKWRCNLCDRPNELPQEFFHDPVTHTVGDPSRRPEIRTATIEYLAPAEYALRPPQAAMYVFLLDVSFNGIEVRYLEAFRERVLAVLDKLPGDARTQIAFIAYDSALHFFQLEASDWRMLTVADIDDVFLPTSDGLLVHLHENMAAVRDLVGRLPEIFKGQRDTHSCMGAAIQVAHKLLMSTGGRITILQTYLPTLGPGALKAREDPNMRAAKEVQFLQPATDFYKTLALECSSTQVAVDLFLLSGQYADLTTISGIARYSGGCIHYYPGFHGVSNPVQLSRFESEFTRYLTRKIGFESVMRLRCTNGMSLSAFHGNFFVRSVDLLSLPNINPDSGFAVQIKMEETLVHPGNVCFQAALLYTSSKGERRIRVHTLSVPVSDSLPEIFAAVDQEAIASIVGKIAAERAFTHPLGDVRDGIVFACQDALSAYTQIVRPQAGQLLVPYSLRLLPLFTHSLLNCVGLRSGISTTLDQRTFSLLQLKAAPLVEEMMTIYPYFYAVHNIQRAPESDDGVPQLDRLHLSYEQIEKGGVYLLEGAFHMILYVTEAVSPVFCQDVLGVGSYNQILDRGMELPELENEASIKLRSFIANRYSLRPLHPLLEITKESGREKLTFIQYLYDDRSESIGSYYEFLTELSRKIKAG